MPDELFRTVAARRSSAGHRLGAVPLSVAVHAALLVVLVVIPLFGNDVLPVPHLPLVWDLPAVPVVVVPSLPVPPSPRVTPAFVSPDASRAPVDAPQGIGQENLALPPSVPELRGEDLGTVVGEGGGAIREMEQPPPLPPVLTPAVPVRVSGPIQPPRKIHNQAPVYPALALAAHVQGTVVIDAVISATGTVQEARVITSVPLLDETALAAVRQWVFTPTRLGGVPVPVILTVKVEFKLQ
jgi:protein TonB